MTDSIKSKSPVNLKYATCPPTSISISLKIPDNSKRRTNDIPIINDGSVPQSQSSSAITSSSRTNIPKLGLKYHKYKEKFSMDKVKQDGVFRKNISKAYENISKALKSIMAFFQTLWSYAIWKFNMISKLFYNVFSYIFKQLETISIILIWENPLFFKDKVNNSIQKKGMKNQCRLNTQRINDLDYVFSFKRNYILTETYVSKNLTLVLDLDGTLVNVTETKPDKPERCYQTIYISSPTDDNKKVYFMQIRPHVNKFLEEMGKRFNIVVFTSASKEYANTVMSHIDKYGIIKRSFFRDSCEKAANGKSVKDLTKVCRDLRRVIMIDNSYTACSKNPSNSIIIKTFTSDENDDELLKHMKFLQTISDDLIDVRDALKTYNPSY